MDEITYLGTTNHRRRKRAFGIKRNDRFSHCYIVGKTGVGKTTLLKKKIFQDIYNWNGLAIFDPHGDLSEDVVEMIPEPREKDFIYLDVANPDLKYIFNPLKNVSKDNRPLVASGLLEAFKKMFSDAWGVNLEHIFRNCLLTLLDQENSTIEDIPKLLTDEGYLQSCLKNVENLNIRNFWTNEYKNYSASSRRTAISPILNKLGVFLSNPIAKRVLVDNLVSISFRDIMDNRKILLINLAKGKIGDDVSNLLGSLFLTSLGLAAFSRQDQKQNERERFFIYCDEFQNFTTSFLVNALSELRKFNIGLILANQYLSQIKADIRESILGNVGTLIVFRTGISDAKYFERELNGSMKFNHIVSLPNFYFYIKLMVNGKPTGGFSSFV